MTHRLVSLATATLLVALASLAPTASADGGAATTTRTACLVDGLDAGCVTGSVANAAPVCDWTGGGAWACSVRWTITLNVQSGMCGEAKAGANRGPEFCWGLGRPDTQATVFSTTHTPPSEGMWYSHGTFEVCARFQTKPLQACEGTPVHDVFIPGPPTTTQASAQHLVPLVEEAVGGVVGDVTLHVTVEG